MPSDGEGYNDCDTNLEFRTPTTKYAKTAAIHPLAERIIHNVRKLSHSPVTLSQCTESKPRDVNCLSPDLACLINPKNFVTPAKQEKAENDFTISIQDDFEKYSCDFFKKAKLWESPCNTDNFIFRTPPMKKQKIFCPRSPLVNHQIHNSPTNAFNKRGVLSVVVEQDKVDVVPDSSYLPTSFDLEPNSSYLPKSFDEVKVMKLFTDDIKTCTLSPIKGDYVRFDSFDSDTEEDVTP